MTESKLPESVCRICGQVRRKSPSLTTKRNLPAYVCLTCDVHPRAARKGKVAQ